MGYDAETYAGGSIIGTLPYIENGGEYGENLKWRAKAKMWLTCANIGTYRQLTMKMKKQSKFVLSFLLFERCLSFFPICLFYGHWSLPARTHTHRHYVYILNINNFYRRAMVDSTVFRQIESHTYIFNIQFHLSTVRRVKTSQIKSSCQSNEWNK